MGAITYDMEIPSSIPALRMFKAFVLDADTLIPRPSRAWRSLKEMEESELSSSQLLEKASSAYKSVKQRVDAVDKANFTYSYSIIEGDALMGLFESISYHIKIVPTPDGGSICKNRSIYHTKGDAQVNEEEIKAGKEKASGMFKAVEAYLLANPDA
ncbi:hypothetical protein RHSIM_Rhsim04G0231100 [Rhododendron simsii]|uniref:Bet v I/Major latex protein domain-containing protein n=1 Tax=Rhododendron simsii TaxID=118357 RepID=A0A834H6N2_RHOSS|nr:hypothetical protein RHSIM_Rhsim04G0231100 [Rhododendron simsii]